MTMTTQTNIQPKRIEKNANPLKIAGLSKKYYFKKPMDPSAQWQQLSSYLGNIPGQKENTAYGVCFDLDNGKGIEYLCGVEVSGDTSASGLPDDFEIRKLPSFTYAVFNHDGHVSEIRKTCDAIWKEWIPESGYDKPKDADFFFEFYGKKFDPRKGTEDIEIWIPIETG